MRVLCVCEGNLCRSPVAEVLLGHAVGPGVEVASAGTRAVVGAPIAPQMRALLLARSLGSGHFRARQLEAGHLRAADLVLPMTRRQRARVVELVPAAVRRTFTLRELARLLDGLDPAELPGVDVGERLREALPAAAARRTYRSDPREDDIDDPYGRDDQAYRRAFDEVADAVARITEVLRAGAVSAP